MYIQMENNPNKCGICQNDSEVKPFNFCNEYGKVERTGIYVCDDCINEIQNGNLKEFLMESIYGEVWKVDLGDIKELN